MYRGDEWPSLKVASRDRSDWPEGLLVWPVNGSILRRVRLSSEERRVGKTSNKRFFSNFVRLPPVKASRSKDPHNSMGCTHFIMAWFSSSPQPHSIEKYRCRDKLNASPLNPLLRTDFLWRWSLQAVQLFNQCTKHAYELKHCLVRASFPPIK